MNAFDATTRSTTVNRGPGRFERTFLDVFTNHPWAKALAVLLGFILVLLIDRQLRVWIFEEDLVVVGEDAARRDAIVVALPPGYVLVQEGSAPAKTFVRIKSLKKDREKIRLPLLASIPASRLGAIDVDPRRAGRVGLEANDIRLPELSQPILEIEQVELLVMKLETKEVTLEHRAVSDPQGYDLEVTFTPDKIAVRGTWDKLQELPPAVIKLAEPASMDQEEQTFTASDLPEAYERRKVRPVNERLVIVAKVRKFERGFQDLTVSSLEILVTAPPGCDYEFALDPPYDRNVYPTLTFEAPKRTVDKHKTDPALLESELKVHVTFLKKQLEDLKEAIEASKEPDGYVYEAPLSVMGLAQFGLRMKDPLRRIPIRIKKKA